MVHHGAITAAEDIHVIYAWAYADLATREAATGFTTSDVNKIARDLDTNALYLLTDDAPITWVQIGGAGAGYSSEDARDDLGTALTAGDNIDIDIDDGSNTITISAPGLLGVEAVPFLGWSAGAYLIHPFQRGGFFSFAGAAIIANRVYAGPRMFFHRDEPVTAMAIWVTGAASAGKIARLGIMEVDDEEGLPTVPALDAGTVLVDASGAAEITGLSWAPTANRWYVPVLVTDGTPDILRAPVITQIMEYSTAAIANVSPGFNHTVYDTVGGTALPNPFVRDGSESLTDGPLVFWIKQS